MNSLTFMTPDLYRINRVRKEVRDVVTLEMSPANGSGPPPFAPGQFNMLYAFGIGEVPISISSDPAKPERLEHTVRAVGAVTKALCRLRHGDVLGVRGPFGTCWPVDQAMGKDVLLIGGGLGLVPLRPVLYALLARREAYGNIALLYGTRAPEDLLYVREFRQWEQRCDLQAEVAVSAASSDWKGHVGVVTKFISRLRFDPAYTLAMICGPEVMMQLTARELIRRDVKPENLFLSMERNMKCGIGLCGHCQLGPFFICKDGPVFSFDRIQDWLGKREV